VLEKNDVWELASAACLAADLHGDAVSVAYWLLCILIAIVCRRLRRDLEVRDHAIVLNGPSLLEGRNYLLGQSFLATAVCREYYHKVKSLRGASCTQAGRGYPPARVLALRRASFSKHVGRPGGSLGERGASKGSSDCGGLTIAGSA
jgi:hypothetical protein